MNDMMIMSDKEKLLRHSKVWDEFNTNKKQIMQTKEENLEMKLKERDLEISLLKEKQKEVSVAFSKWWGLCNPNMFKETDTIFDAFDLYLKSESYKQLIK
jgi:hypothetical protein